MKRLFLAIPVHFQIVEKIELLYEQLKEVGKISFVSFTNLHLTLKYLGETEEEKIPEIKKIVQEAIEQEHSFSLDINSIGVFPSLKNPKVIWAGVFGNEIIPLMKKINSVLTIFRENEYKEEVPHLTLARIKFIKDHNKLKQIINEQKNQVYGKVIVDNFVLYESVLTPQGPIYNALQEFSLLS